MNTTGIPVGIIMLDKITGMPINTETPQEISKMVLPKSIESKIEQQYNIVRVLFILLSTFLCLVFIFIQIFSCYASK